MGLAAAIGVGAVASVAGGVIASGGAKSAANTSAAAADKSAAVQQDIFNQNKQTLSPYVQAGLPATGMINNALGLGANDPASINYSAFVDANPEALAAFNAQQSSGAGQYSPLAGWGRNSLLGQLNAMGSGNAGPAGALDKAAFGKQWAAQNNSDLSAYTTPGQTAADKAQGAFDTFRNSTGYNFRVNQGMNALNSGYAGAGTIKSGAAIKAATDYGQGMASQEFGNWLNALGSQQGVGLNAAGAQAGVSSNYANALGNIYQQNGANQANAALAGANAMGSGIGNITNLIGLGMGAGVFKK